MHVHEPMWTIKMRIAHSKFMSIVIHFLQKIFDIKVVAIELVTMNSVSIVIRIPVFKEHVAEVLSQQKCCVVA